MNKMKVLLTFGIALLIAVICSVSVSHSELNQANRLKLKLLKPQGTQERRIAQNNWGYYLRNDGSYMYKASANAFGGEYPKGTNYSCVYAAGLYVAGKKAGAAGDPDTINVANCEFQSEFRPGKVLVGGVKDNKYRGYKKPNTGGDVTKTDDYGNLTADSYLSSEYKVYLIPANSDDPGDYDAWPVYAPRLVDGKPLQLEGSVAQTYSVFNDLSTDKVTDQYSLSPGFGLEMELESFVFNTGLLNNGLFMKLSITNKSSHDYREAHLGLWADPDVGSEHGEDLAAVDTNRGLGMVYSNPAGVDPSFTALGLDFLQGPVVNIEDVDQSLIDKFYNNPDYRKVLKFIPEDGILDTFWLPPNQFRLGATAFVSYRNGVGDPDGSNGSGDVTRYWYVSGVDGLTGLAKPNGKYDPTTSGTTPGDQRIIHGVGPFILKSGITQEIWLGFVGAQGTSNGPGAGTIYNPSPLSAIQLLQATDDAMQVAFDNALAAPTPPASPVVTATAFDQKVVLTWDNRSEKSYDRFGDLLKVKKPTFNYDWVGYDFQGYRVYRSLTGFADSWTQLAEYDLIDGITVQNDTASDDRGTVTYDVHFGSDNGVVHHYIDEDLINQRLYYYSVTSYDYQPLFRQTTNQKIAGYPRSLENAKDGKDNLKLVVPMAAPAGVSYDGTGVRSLQKVAGTFTNAYMSTIVVDPTKTAGNKSYTVELFKLDTVTVNNRRLQLPASLVGTLAFRLKDSASGQYIKFDNFLDDPVTYFDTLTAAVPLGNDTFELAKGDTVFDDSYYSIAISYTDIAGAELPLKAGVVSPILNGVSLKLVSDTIGIRDFVEIADSSGTLTTPRSVFYQSSTKGDYEVRIMGNTDTLAKSVRYTTGRRAMNYFNPITMTSDYEIRFYDTDSAGVYMSIGTGNNPGLASGNFTRKARVPFEIWKIGYYDDTTTTDDKKLAMKMRQLPPAINTFAINNPIGTDSAWSERFSIVDTSYFYAAAGFGAITPTKIMAVDFVLHSLKKPAVFPYKRSKIRVETYRPVQAGNKFIYRQIGNSPYSKNLAKQVFNDVKVVPNPYYGRYHEYQGSLFDKKVKFINLPNTCTIRIFTVSGDLIRTIRHNSTSANNRVDADPLNRTKDVSTIAALETSTEQWDLRNTKGSFVASGMYIALIEAPGLGKQTVKFAVIQEEMRINGPDVR